MEKYPKISIVTCTYNGERTIEEFLENLFSQDYPKNKIELILTDGGSKDKTLEIIDRFKKKYPKSIKFIKNPKQFSEGRGMGKDLASRRASGEFIVFLDQDNILVQKDWLKKSVELLSDEKDFIGLQSLTIVPRKGTLIDRYLALIGIEEPFAIPYSLSSQIVLNPHKFEYEKEKGYYIYEINKKSFFYGGNNGFLIKKKNLFEFGGYTQDIDNFYRMADKNKKIIIHPDIKIYHKTSTNFRHFFKKRSFYIRYYLTKNYENRDFYWFDLKKNNFRQNSKFIINVLFNLALLPGLFQGVRMSMKKGEFSWMLHPIILFVSTVNLIYSHGLSKFLKIQQTPEI